MFWIVLRWGSHDSRSLLVKFLAFCICFSSFLHDFCVEYLRRTNFSRATRFLVDLPAHGGAVGFFISGFVATALKVLRPQNFRSKSRRDRATERRRDET